MTGLGLDFTTPGVRRAAYCASELGIFIMTSMSRVKLGTQRTGMEKENVYMSHLMTKPTKWHVRPAKTDQPGHSPSLISLRCPHEESLGL